VEKVLAFMSEFITHKLKEEQITRTGQGRHLVSLVVDLEGLGFRQLYPPALRYFTHLLYTSDTQYPEAIRSLFLINTPAIFQAFWKIIKPALSERLLSKIHILGSDYRELLLTFYPPENLPACFGGLCNCRYPGGCVPFPVSDDYRNPMEDANGYFIIKIEPNSAYKLPVAIRQDEFIHYCKTNETDEMMVQCRFQTSLDNIRFGIEYFKDFELNYNAKNGQLFQDVKTVRSLSQLVLENVKITEAGLYVFVFSNPNDTMIEVHYMLSE